MKQILWFALALSLVACDAPKRVGTVGDGAVATTGQLVRGAGSRVWFAGRPVDLALTPDGSVIVVKDYNVLRTIDTDAWQEHGTTPIPGGASLTGIKLSPDGKTAYVTSSKNTLLVFDIADPAKPALAQTITLPGPEGKGNSFPCGLELIDGGKKALVALSINNQLATVDLEAGKVLTQVDVGVAPYGVAVDSALGLAVVSEQGGPRPSRFAPAADSAGSRVEVDARGIANHGSVSVFDIRAGKVVKQLEVGLQASAVAIDETSHLAYVCATNEDSVAVVDLSKLSVKSTIGVKPDRKLPFGSMPTALGLSPDRSVLYVALAGNNALAVVDTKTEAVKGFIPTDWFPAGIVTHGKTIFVVNNKGLGARQPGMKEGSARNSHNKGGTASSITVPTTSELRAYTKQVIADSLVPITLANMERNGKSTVAPVPVPKRLGDPSVIKHVVYVIKENRTYDQVFGDIPEGDGQKDLCIFGEDVTPNQHALARQYVLLDNYYCNGVLSADGHSWATEGNVTPYLNRAFGGFTRSYTFGDDPITYSSSGFVWDGVLAAGLTIRNYGEMDDATPAAGRTGKQIFEDYKNGKFEEFNQRILIKNLKQYSCRDYPGWNMNIPDNRRMDAFLREFREFEAKGVLPNFMTLYLPQDHTGGPVTPRAHVADNDYAVGRLIDALSHSQFWKDTVVFINEDDPQAGTDHVDGHRSTCLVVSPYTRGRGTVSQFYNQTSVLHTINRIFGIMPMNQRDSSSNLMTECFNSKPDVSPFTVIPPRIDLYEYPKTQAEMGAKELALWKLVSKIDLSEREVQTESEMDVLNRWLWHQQKGFETPYPSEWAGAHGKGLKQRGLELVRGVEPDWDD